MAIFRLFLNSYCSIFFEFLSQNSAIVQLFCFFQLSSVLVFLCFFIPPPCEFAFVFSIHLLFFKCFFELLAREFGSCLFFSPCIFCSVLLLFFVLFFEFLAHEFRSCCFFQARALPNASSDRSRSAGSLSKAAVALEVKTCLMASHLLSSLSCLSCLRSVSCLCLSIYVAGSLSKAAVAPEGKTCLMASHTA